MNEWLKKLFSHVKELWSKWSVVKKVILTGIVIAVVGGFILVITVLSRPMTVALFSVPVTDSLDLLLITYRLSQENVEVDVTEAGMIFVADESTARKMRTILVTEDLVPSHIDPWNLFDKERWTITTACYSGNPLRSITMQLTQQIESLDGIDSADVMIGMPEIDLFSSEQKPVTASVILTPKPDSYFTADKKKIEDVQELLIVAIPGLLAENITIVDAAGTVLNDFVGMVK